MTEAAAKEHFEQLDPKVKDFLGRLDGDDVRLLKRSIDLSRHVASTALVVRWVIITVLGTIIATAALGDAIGKIVAWFVRN